MTGRQWGIMITTVIGAAGGVFLGAGADASWEALTAPMYVIGSIVSAASAAGAFFEASPRQSRQYDGR